MTKTLEIRPDFKSNKKQQQAIQVLLNHTNGITQLLYGGAATGGKSWLGCAWITICALRLPNTRWVIGRSVLKTLKETTLVTLFEIFRSWKIEEDKHYKFNTKDNVITFDASLGSSVIILKDLFAYPSDPEFDSLGSLEITGAFIDEVAQVTKKAIQVLTGRIRFKLTAFCGLCWGDLSGAKQIKFRKDNEIDTWICPHCGKETIGLLPKLLMTCNPTKGWLYMDFYKPFRENRMPEGKLFIKALVTDNPKAPQENIKALKNIEDEPTRQRLYYGNWEYDSEEGSIMRYEKIIQIFENRSSPAGDMYITCDPARMGRDKTVIMVWSGWRVEQIVTINKGPLTDVADKIIQLSVKYGIDRKRVLVDTEGVGGGLADILGCSSYVSSNTPLKEMVHRYRMRMNYANLRAQCFWGLSLQVNNNILFVNTDNSDIRALVVEELEQIRRKDMDKDGRMLIVPKAEIRENIQRSPDYADCLAMRRWFDLKKVRKFLI